MVLLYAIGRRMGDADGTGRVVLLGYRQPSRTLATRSLLPCRGHDRTAHHRPEDLGRPRRHAGSRAPAVLAVDLHLIHEVTSPQAFSELRERGLRVRRPGQTVATADHSIPTHDRSLPMLDPMAAAQVRQLETNCAEFGIPLHGIGSPHQGIVHVIGPQLGLTQPGMTIVCGDSHTSTHGAFGALAFGIGTSEVEMVLATQTLLQRDLKTYEVRVDGRLAPGVSSKDIILALIARIGVGGGTATSSNTAAMRSGR